MLLATSQGVPPRMMCSSLPQRLVEGWVFALGLGVWGRAATVASSAARAAADRGLGNMAVKGERVNE